MGKTLIIAEAGVNHNGSFEMAKQLVDRAKEAGADFVKFQTAKLESLVSKHAEMAEYQKKNTGQKTSQKDMLRKLLLPYEDFIKLSEYCKSLGVGFLSTPFDIESIYFLKGLVPFWKVPSGEITNYPYLIEIAKTNMPVVLSTGMCEISEIDDAVALLKGNGRTELTLLHCNTQYPTPYDDVNLHAMETLKNRYGLKVGYSDHTQGIEVPIAAVALGATIIEKHFTLDHTLPGPDHKASLEPQELKEMVRSIRNIESALGSSEKKVSPSERNNITVARKSIVASRCIKRGEILNSENLTTKRPGTGISPMQWNQIVGTRAVRDFEEDELIEI